MTKLRKILLFAVSIPLTLLTALGVLLAAEYFGIGLSNYIAPSQLIAAIRKLPPVSQIEIYRFVDQTADAGSAENIPTEPAPYSFSMNRIYRNGKSHTETYAASARASISGEEAESFASIWRSIGLGNLFESACHFPGYGVHIHTTDGSVVSATLCWECGNLALANDKGIYGFRSYAGNGDRLRVELERITKRGRTSPYASASGESSS